MLPAKFPTEAKIATRTSLRFHAELPVEVPTGEVLAGARIPAAEVRVPVAPAEVLVHIHNKGLAGVPPEGKTLAAKVKMPAAAKEIKVDNHKPSPLATSSPPAAHELSTEGPRTVHEPATSCPQAAHELSTGDPRAVHEPSASCP